MGVKLRSDHEFLGVVCGWPVALPIAALIGPAVGPAAYGMFVPLEGEIVEDYGPKVTRDKLAMPIILRMQASY